MLNDLEADVLEFFLCVANGRLT